MVGFTALYGIAGVALWAHGWPPSLASIGFIAATCVGAVAAMMIAMIAIGFAPEVENLGPGCFVACLVELAAITAGGWLGESLGGRWGALGLSLLSLVAVAILVAFALRARRPNQPAV